MNNVNDFPAMNFDGQQMNFPPLGNVNNDWGGNQDWNQGPWQECGHLIGMVGKGSVQEPKEKKARKFVKMPEIDQILHKAKSYEHKNRFQELVEDDVVVHFSGKVENVKKGCSVKDTSVSVAGGNQAPRAPPKGRAVSKSVWREPAPEVKSDWRELSPEVQ